MSASVAPPPCAGFCRLIAEFSESLMTTKYRAQSPGTGKVLIMKRGFAVALHLAVAASALGAGICGAFAQQTPVPDVCNQFQPLSQETQKRANAVQDAMKAKSDPKQLCALLNSFVTAEGTLVKF